MRKPTEEEIQLRIILRQLASEAGSPNHIFYPPALRDARKILDDTAWMDESGYPGECLITRFEREKCNYVAEKILKHMQNLKESAKTERLWELAKNIACFGFTQRFSDELDQLVRQRPDAAGRIEERKHGE